MMTSSSMFNKPFSGGQACSLIEQINMSLFRIFIHQRSLENVSRLPEILSSTTVFNIDHDYKEYFLHIRRIM